MALPIFKKYKYKVNVPKNTIYLVMLLSTKRKLWAIFLPRGSSWSKHPEAGLNLQGFWSLWAYAHNFQRHLLTKLIVVNENCCLCTYRMSPTWILKRLVSVFINACRLSSVLPSLSQFGRGRLSLVTISFYAVSLLFGTCCLSEFTLAGPREPVQQAVQVILGIFFIVFTKIPL